MKVFASLIPMALLLMSFSCEPDPAGEPIFCPELPLEASCAGDVPCLEFFKTIQVQLSLPGGEAVVLDSFQSRNLVSGEVYALKNRPETAADAAGTYPVLTDSELNSISPKGSPIEFTGYQAGAELLKRVFIIGHDCCHVLGISGDPAIVLSAN